jgi:hypothetical protein
MLTGPPPKFHGTRDILHLTGLVSDDGTAIANAYVPSPRARSNRLITGT